MKNNAKKNKKSFSSKKNSTNESTFENSYTQVSKHRQHSGQVFETEITNRLLSRGIVTTKLSVGVSRGLTKISDNYLSGKKNHYWIESTTCITNMARVDEFIRKKEEVLKTNPHINKWVIFYRKDNRQNPQSPTSIRNYRKCFMDEGITLCFGDEEINNYINGIVDTENIIRRPIRMARAEMIPLSKIVKNKDNRPNILKSVDDLTSGIIEKGFITQLNVVPESINGVLTGRFVLTEGDNRNSSLLNLIELGYEFETGEDPLIPCSVVYWLTSECDESNGLIIDTNTKSYPWTMMNYIDFHEKTSAGNIEVEYEKNFSYNVLQFLRSDDARMTEVLKHPHKPGDFEKISESYLIYVFGPRKHGRTFYRGLDVDTIYDGTYRETEENFEKIKFFLDNIFHPFYYWFRTELEKKKYEKMIPRRFMGGLFYRYLENKDLGEVMSIIEVFKNLGDDLPRRESDVNHTLWELIDAKLALRNSN